jgi:Tol biopolymer transport system component
MRVVAAVAAGVLAGGTSAAVAAPHPATVDDLMRLRSISDVRISPDGRQIAYVVSEPSSETDSHEPAVYRIPVEGGEPVRLTHTTRVFNRPVPSPSLRFSPDGTYLSFLGWVGEVPQVLAMRASGGEPRALTTAPEGVMAYEWAPDSRRIAYLAPEPTPADETRRRKEKSYVIEVDRNQRPPRVWVADLAGGEPRVVTPSDRFVSSLAWSPDGSTIAYASSARSDWAGQFHTRIHAVPTAPA